MMMRMNFMEVMKISDGWVGPVPRGMGPCLLRADWSRGALR